MYDNTSNVVSPSPVHSLLFKLNYLSSMPLVPILIETPILLWLRSTLFCYLMIKSSWHTTHSPSYFIISSLVASLTCAKATSRYIEAPRGSQICISE